MAKAATKPKSLVLKAKPSKGKSGRATGEDEAGPLTPLGSCCAGVCGGVGVGKILIVVCDGTTMKALSGTADGQYLAWDDVAKTWVLANA
jgi:hypothetical protein